MVTNEEFQEVCDELEETKDNLDSAIDEIEMLKIRMDDLSFLVGNLLETNRNLMVDLVKLVQSTVD